MEGIKITDKFTGGNVSCAVGDLTIGGHYRADAAGSGITEIYLNLFRKEVPVGFANARPSGDTLKWNLSDVADEDVVDVASAARSAVKALAEEIASGTGAEADEA